MLLPLQVDFNEDYSSYTLVKQVTALTARDDVHGKLILGLACNPMEPAERFKIWVGHSDMFNPVRMVVTSIPCEQSGAGCTQQYDLPKLC